MTDWPDQKICSTALWYIEKAAMDPPTWRHTRIGKCHPEVSSRVQLQPGELVVVSSFLSDASWYLFTTRRILGSYGGQGVEMVALDVLDFDFANFKGYGQLDILQDDFLKSCGEKETEVMTLRHVSGIEARLEYETGRASMAPIFYMRYWKIKFPSG